MMQTHNSRFLQELNRRVLIYDGAMGTSLQKLNLTAEDFGGERYFGCNDYLVITKPDAVEGVHRGFLDVGCDVLETDTFRSNRITLKEYGLQDRVIAINRTAAQLARRLADEYSTPEKPRFVAGSIGPSGLLPSSTDPVLSNVTFDELVDVFREQAAGLIQGGVDVLLIETSQDILEVKAAIFGCHKAMAETGKAVPIQCQVTLDTAGRMLLGTDIAAALTTLEVLPIDIIGLNCSTGPEHMREPIRYLTEHATLPVSCIPNAGLPINTGTGEAIYPLEPEPMAQALYEFVNKLGVRIVGGCCGTTPAHLKAVVDAITLNVQQPALSATQGSTLNVQRSNGAEPRISSAMRAITMRQDPPPLLIGERINSQGSRKVKRLLLEEKYEDIVAVAREQVEGGAHALDVCVALTERQDEADQMRKLVHLLSATVEAPLVIDSTERDAIEAALKAYPGRAVVNSINMERGRERIDAIVPLVKAHGAAVIALTIDEQGMAKTAQRKLAVARRIYEIVVGEYGLAPSDLIFDDLTFTLATGDPEFRRSAIETIEGIRLIKRDLPGVFTSLGVSNVSFGLSPRARAVLNSVFLYHCVQAGLDMAIVNPAHITPYAEIDAEQRALAEDLIFDRREDALTRYIAYFEAHATEETAGTGGKTDPTVGMTAEEKIHWQIVHRKKEQIEKLIDEALARHDPVWVLNNVLLPAMKEVGDKFGAGELILPFVLQSAEVMKKAVAHLEQFLERKEGMTKGTVVLATVYGDVHDIGKNLVNTILTNNGYTVYDLGKQVPINVIIDKAIEVQADAIGLSALLVSTSKQMPACVKELYHRGLNFPVLIGGAAINRRFGRRALFVDDNGTMYGPGVFYCNDAFEGLETMDRLTNPAQRDAFIAQITREALEDEFLYAGRAARLERGGGAVPGIQRSNVKRDVPIPKPPFWGWAEIPEIPLDRVFACLDLRELFRVAWGARGQRGENWEALVEEEFKPRLERMMREARIRKTIRPRAVYGYWPCQSQGNTLIVYDPAPFQNPKSQTYSGRSESIPNPKTEVPLREIARFEFPRQADRLRLCLADYFASVDSGIVDVVAFQVVTVGDEADRLSEELQQQGEYSEGFYWHGLSVEAAEATAEYVNRHIRRELGLAEKQGLRYSWGYPACPDLSDHVKVFELLPAREVLGVELTSAYQLVPEQSTAAMVVHHPEAVYFAAP